ncbi:MAG TPA: hypothetical protein VFI02_20655, partial [Armatimonadota bacterium]|nr:hypothetical protein [Armatimonadota bacterium]
TITVSAETYERLMGHGQFPETVDSLIVRLCNGDALKPHRKIVIAKVATPEPTEKKKKVRHRIGCEWCNRVFLGGQGYASHLRHFHPKHYNPKNPVPLSERKTVIYRKADGSTETVHVRDLPDGVDREVTL